MNAKLAEALAIHAGMVAGTHTVSDLNPKGFVDSESTDTEEV